MNEKEFGSKVRQRLEEGKLQIDGITLARLEEARHRALSRVRAAERELVTASSRNGQMTLSMGSRGGEQHPQYLRAAFVGLALIALMAGSVYWQQANDDDGDQGLMDAKMLSSELPLYTFIHPDFKVWVDTSR
jgi:hypothetical protein